MLLDWHSKRPGGPCARREIETTELGTNLISSKTGKRKTGDKIKKADLIPVDSRPNISFRKKHAYGTDPRLSHALNYSSNLHTLG